MSYNIENLMRILAHHEIPFSYNKLNNGDGLTVKYNNKEYSVVCHDFSYGHEDELLEVCNYAWDDVYGWKTAEEVFNIIKLDFY